MSKIKKCIICNNNFIPPYGSVGTIMEKICSTECLNLRKKQKEANKEFRLNLVKTKQGKSTGIDVNIEIICNICKEIKPISDFCESELRKNKRKCRACVNKFNKKYYEENNEKILENFFLYGSRQNKHKYNKELNRSRPGFLNADIGGLCSMCGEILLFGEYHHIFGNGNGFTTMLCNECHTTSNMQNINNHCLSIGRRIAWGALCYY